MRTRALSFILVLSFVMSLVGCGKKTPELSSEVITQGTKTTEVTSFSESESIDNSTLDNETDTFLDESDEKQEDITIETESILDTYEETEVIEETIYLEEEASLETEEVQQNEENESLRKAEKEKIQAEQLNSFSMMYYLAITAEEIRTSKDNRLILDDIYTSLLNDINPGAVDEITQEHLKNLRDIIKAYRNISIKRDRLQYIYNQNKAAAMRSAVPNPLAILSMANSLDWKRLAVSVVYTAVDTYNSYKTASENADKSFLTSGWDLDDEEIETVQKNRDRAFDYMVDMVQEYHLDGLKTLNEESIEKFAEICAIESAPERISRLRSEEETYNLLGNYWLELADCYFETDQYSKCLECVEKYNELATGIYRKDYNYVQILPKAIVAAQNTYTGSKYNSAMKEFTDAIIKNTTTEDWSTRYFVSQVYLDLYSRTNDQTYLKAAYKIAYENITILLQGQRDLNNTYLTDIQEVKVEEPDYRYLSGQEKKEKEAEYKEERKRAKTYNKTLKKERITELPSLYEPLVLNCELLFALSEKLDITDSEKSEIEAILKTSSYETFITKPINDAFSFSERDNKYSISFDKDDIGIPAALLTAGSIVSVTVTENGNTETFDDCVIQKVVRKGDTIDSFTAYYKSKTLKKHKWTEDSKITITIHYTDASDRTVTFNYKVIDYHEHWYGDKVVFGEA